jgi:hypothetical protein
VLAYRFVILPRRHVDENGAADIEQRTDAFGGRNVCRDGRRAQSNAGITRRGRNANRVKTSAE